ncbi:hypothetical protein FAM09_11310 [Niastella caeni]|uniref:Uncharacterized protein n=1 Tax=Niastella caeni TaxID=2569763 RepID=A0A4S8I349_9BACT|nr:hypothetical protein [Niastella caeni]THU40442.1 hypothetical protein FAM09_11310 [Niastella caeni]
MFDISKQIVTWQHEEPENNYLSIAGDDQPVTITLANNIYDKQATHHFFVGDETTVELFNALKEIALQKGHEYFGILELHPEYEAVLSMLKLLVDSVPELPGEPAQNAIEWMEEMHPHCWMAWQNATFYLAGGEILIKTFQQYLLQKKVTPQLIRIIK